MTNPSPIDDPLAAFYTVGQVATMLGVQPAFLRRLDAEQVVCPARSSGGQRRYSRTEIGQLERVNELVTEGLNLEGVRRIMQLEAEVAGLRSEIEAERVRRRGR